MQDQVNYLAPVAEDSVENRSEFVWKTYAHVVGAILAFAGVSAYLYQSGISERIAMPMLSNWLLVLGAFMLVGWGASHVAHRVQSIPAQYAALAFFVVAEALIFAPLLFIAASIEPGIIEAAAGVTLLGCGGLIAVAMITRKDLSLIHISEPTRRATISRMPSSA